MAQRISRAKRRVAGVPLDRPGDLHTVLRVLYLVFNEGYGGDVNLAAEAIRLARQLLSRCSTRPQGLRKAAAARHSRDPVSGTSITLCSLQVAQVVGRPAFPGVYDGRANLEPPRLSCGQTISGTRRCATANSKSH